MKQFSQLMMRSAESCRLSVALIVLAIILPSGSPAATYYVSVSTGDDWAHDGLAPAPSGSSGPFQTISRAVGFCAAGDNVRVRGGQYVESVFVNIDVAKNTI